MVTHIHIGGLRLLHGPFTTCRGTTPSQPRGARGLTSLGVGDGGTGPEGSPMSGWVWVAGAVWGSNPKRNPSGPACCASASAARASASYPAHSSAVSSPADLCQASRKDSATWRTKPSPSWGSWWSSGVGRTTDARTAGAVEGEITGSTGAVSSDGTASEPAPASLPGGGSWSYSRRSAEEWGIVSPSKLWNCATTPTRRPDGKRCSHGRSRRHKRKG